jgi:hypothetical protein
MGERSGIRVVGLEGLGRFKSISLPFKNGCEGALYCLSAVDGAAVTEFAAITHPLREDAIWAKRVNGQKPDGSRSYGRWEKCQPPYSLTGFASIKSTKMSDKQAAWWKKDAGFFGLDNSREVASKTFQALPILSDLRVRFK